MIVKMNREAISAVEDAMRRGKDALVRRKGDGIIVEEQNRKIIYSAHSIESKQGQ